MTQEERRIYLIKALLSEKPEYRKTELPSHESGQRQLLRSLMNLREAAPLSPELIRIQDAYLQEDIRSIGITALDDLAPMADGLYLWQGDITTLKCDAIVNAANSGMTGCYLPCHNCIDNCIHTYAGMQLRLACAELMERQGHEEPTGTAKLTPAYNLPCRYVLHTVGPIVDSQVTPQDEALLASCYRSCMELAVENGLKSVAFCCISTGVFCFPNHRAAEIAIATVRQFLKDTGSDIKVIFNVFKDEDYDIYRSLLS